MNDDSHQTGDVRGVLASAALLVLAVGAGAQEATERASLNWLAFEASGDSDQVSLSADGRYVAFRSLAADLVPDDTNGVADVFVRDRWTGAVERISVSTLGLQAADESGEPHISADGRYVAFTSEANNLVTDVPPGTSKDVFLRDRLLRTTRIVTVASTGLASNGDCHKPRVSNDGRYVSFEGSATNLIPGVVGTNYQVFRRDMQGSTALVSVNLAGTPGVGFSWNGAISGDGRYVAFVSSVSNLVTGDTNGQTDCFWRDLQTGLTRRVSVSSAGQQGTGATFTGSSMSRNGRWVAFASSSPNLAPGEFAAGYDIFLHDTQTSETHRITFSSTGVPANQNSYDPAVSDDGRYVAFQSFSTNLDPLDTDLDSDVFLRDRQLGTTRLMSRSATTSADRDAFNAAISGLGNAVAFHSGSTNLVPADTNAKADVFVRTLDADHPAFCAGVASVCPCANGGVGAAGCENSRTTGGALLRGFGSARLAADQVTLLAIGLPSGSSALFFQGTARENGGAGVAFGDGLRCAGGAVIRLATYGVVAGTAAIGFGGTAGLGGGTTTPIHQLGNIPPTGGTRTYQVWYRNSAVFCTAATYNLSNGVEITWLP
ncbi:MAG: PD40 domain-containing protein [Planctomycetes bacterium]|nr:PD40 domain-containing protein [Planctomycetota bacterium]